MSSESVEDFCEFVKSRIAFHEKRSRSGKIPPEHAARHKATADKHLALLNFLQSIRQDHENDTNKFSLSAQKDWNPDDLFDLNPLRIDDLPEELKDEIKPSDAELFEYQIVELFNIAKRPLTINEIAAGLYRRFDVEQRRTPLANRIYRMCQTKQLESVEGKKGVYQPFNGFSKNSLMKRENFIIKESPDTAES